jgi:hypothetical protein
MRAKARSEGSDEAPVSSEIAAFKRIGNLLGLLVVKGEKQEKQIETLSGAGFSNSEIAQLLNTSPAVVGQTLYVIRKAAGRTKRRAPKARKA